MTPAHPVLAGLDHLRSLEGGQATMGSASREVITDAWRPLVVVDGHVERRGYSLCVLDRLRLALRRRDVYVIGADRWGDPGRLLMDPTVWKGVGPQILRMLDLPERAPSYLERLGAELDAAYFAAASAIAEDPTMWVEEGGPETAFMSPDSTALMNRRAPRRCDPTPTPCSPRSNCPSCCSRSRCLIISAMSASPRRVEARATAATGRIPRR